MNNKQAQIDRLPFTTFLLLDALFGKEGKRETWEELGNRLKFDTTNEPKTEEGKPMEHNIEEVTEITFAELKRKVEAKEPMFVLATEDKEVKTYLDNLTDTASSTNVEAYRVNVEWGNMFGVSEIGIDMYRSHGLKAPVFKVVSATPKYTEEDTVSVEPDKYDFSSKEEIVKYLKEGNYVYWKHNIDNICTIVYHEFCGRFYNEDSEEYFDVLEVKKLEVWFKTKPVKEVKQETF